MLLSPYLSVDRTEIWLLDLTAKADLTRRFPADQRSHKRARPQSPKPPRPRLVYALTVYPDRPEGPKGAAPQPRVYVGQTDHLAGRLRAHLSLARIHARDANESLPSFRRALVERQTRGGRLLLVGLELLPADHPDPGAREVQWILAGALAGAGMHPKRLTGPGTPGAVDDLGAALRTAARLPWPKLWLTALGAFFVAEAPRPPCLATDAVCAAPRLSARLRRLSALA